MIRLLATIAIVLAGATTFADTSASRQLTALEAEIDSLARRIQADRSALDQAEQALEETERRISTLIAERDALAQRMSDIRARIDQLDRQNEEASTRLPVLREQLGEALRVRHRLSRQSRAGILLKQNDPAKVQRTLTYFDILLAAQTRHIEQLRDAMAHLLNARRDLHQQRARLESTRSEYEEHVARLEQARQQRSSDITALNARVDDANLQLAARQRERIRLDQLVSGIATIHREHSAPPQAVTPQPSPTQLAGLSHQRGRMKLPAAGAVITRFSQPDPLSEIPSSGIVIATGQDADVRSISDGQVVYSDWFRGFGLLLILDHGEGFLSLYGYNSELLFPVGARVAANTPIARAGNTSGRQREGVYFEMRHAGRPLDPMQWCESRGG